MGFWHTGYMEFHEPVGLGGFYINPSPPTFPCSLCSKIFPSLDDLRRHRFEDHPLHRPVLYLNGQEVGRQTIRLTRPLTADQVRIDYCKYAVLNGHQVPVADVPKHLAQFSDDIVHVILRQNDVSSEFTLDFRIASEIDLKGVELEFERTANSKRLDLRSIDDFISVTSRFKSAIGYCDGICSYLYGALAKERAADSSLSYDAYVGKFNAAADDLAAYDRPLARTIGSLIQFHFNHFHASAQIAGASRVGFAAARYASWIERTPSEAPIEAVPVDAESDLEALVSDWETEQILRWSVLPLHGLLGNTTEMESFLERDLAEYDRAKIHILLAETYARSGPAPKARFHAKTLRNLSSFEPWAEAILSTSAEGSE